MKFKEVDIAAAGSEPRKAVWSLMKSRKQLKISDVVSKFNYSNSAITIAMKKLVELGAVVQVEACGKKVCGTYRLADGVTR